MKRRELLGHLGLLLGGVLSSACQRAVLSGGAAMASNIGLFSADQQRQIAILAELIIPETDTPGAIAAGVPGFVGYVVSDWANAEEQQTFLDGLADLDAWCQERHGVRFVAASAKQQGEALEEMAKRARDAGPIPPSILPGPPVGLPFFLQLREYVVIGYFTSEVGATQALTHNPIPGRYDGDYPASKVTSQWS